MNLQQLYIYIIYNKYKIKSEKLNNKVRKALKYKRLRLFVLHLTMF
nr:MAG TPA: hypothetical protein [Caudoviricetes sp.]